MEGMSPMTSKKVEELLQTGDYLPTGVILQHKDTNMVVTVCNGKIFWPDKITTQCIAGKDE